MPLLIKPEQDGARMGDEMSETGSELDPSRYDR